MSSLYGILAAKNVVHQIPTYMLIACGVILAIAFIIGMIRGFRKIAWGGFYWLFATISFIVVYKAVAAKNPFTSKFKGDLADLAGFAWVFLIALGCIAVALIIYGILGIILRPRDERVKEDTDDFDEYTFEFEEEWEIDDITESQGFPVVVGGGKPTLFGRLAGGFMCMVNAAAVLMVIMSIFLLVIRETKLYIGDLGAMFDVPLARHLLKYTKAYALDFFTIGIIMWIIYRGYKTGFVNSARTVLITIGVSAVVIIAFVIPFTTLSKGHFFNSLIYRCGDLYTRMKPQPRGICARLTAGALMAAVGAAVVLIIGFILRKITEEIEETRTARIIDGVFAGILYLFVAIVVVAAFWGILYLLDYCGIFYTSDAFSEDSLLSEEFFKAAEKNLKSFADKYLLRLKAK